MNEKMREILETPIGKKVWIAAHRGRFGGSIPENTLAAFQASIQMGADIVETDITKLADGEFILFHDETLDRITRSSGEVSRLTYDQMKKIELLNSIGEPSHYYVNTLNELLHELKGRCIINLDKCRDYLDEVYERVLEYEMEDQILLKNYVPCKKDIEWLRSSGYHPLYVPVVVNEDDISQLYEVLQVIDVKVVEVFLKDESSKLISEEFVSSMHNRGIKIWVNALTLGGDNQISSGRDDNLSILKGPEYGWGWLIEKGADIIQTDWTLELSSYLHRIGKA